MSYWVCCNSCFLSPSPERKLAVTSCGHVICSVCYQTGSHGRCLICSSQCQISPLSDKSSSDVKALFSDIGVVATRHLTEFSKVVTFQARHQKRLLGYYKQRNQNLEEMLVKMKQEMQQMVKALNEQRAYVAKLENSHQHHSLKASFGSQNSSSSHTPHGNKPVLQIPYNSPVFLPRHASATNISESMEVDERSLFRKPNSAPRLSVMKSPQEGRTAANGPDQNRLENLWSIVQRKMRDTRTNDEDDLKVLSEQPGPPEPEQNLRLVSSRPRRTDAGTVSHRSYSQSPLTTHSAQSATVRRFPATPQTPESYGQSSAWKSPLFRPPSSFRHSTSSPGFPP